MSYLSYTALREIEASGFVKIGTDISVSAADDSINAVSTDLSALLADQWVLVSGFANAANNGWFQAKANAVAGKILTLTPPISHLRLGASAGNYAHTPDTAANSLIGDLDLIVKVALNDWTPAGVQTLIAKWNTTGNQRSYALSINPAGTLNLSWSANGTAVISKDSTVATSLADLAVKYVRATLDVDNGAAGNSVRFFTSSDGLTWTQLGATVTTAGVTNVFNSTSELEVGSINSGTSQLLSGRLYYAALLLGAVVAAFTASLGVRGALTLTAATGEVWTISQSGTPPALLQGSALVTEAAGANVTLTGYVRGLNQSYTLEFYSERVDRSVQVKRTEHQPMGGGAPETLLYRRETFVEVAVLGDQGALITEQQMLKWREFMASVEGGELFTFDRYGTVAVPIEPKTVRLQSDSYMEQRIAGIGAQGVYKLEFQVRVL